MLTLWEEQSRSLESRALASLTNQDIDEVFAAVSSAVREPIANGVYSYLERTYGKDDDHSKLLQRTYDESVCPDVIESIERDMLGRS
jgi:L-aminopeptidase/D-esterase-like protein